MNAVWIFIGGGLGSVARYWMSGWVASRVGEVFPWGTLLVNVSGSFLIGLLATVTDPDGRFWLGASVRQFLLLGFLGGYTTFSSFSWQTLTLMREGQWGWAAANAALSVVLCLAAVTAGYFVGMYINQKFS
ncbi:fluoride efflux transporter CrcB [Fontisphaera persica]|uniref:fluoride efflux transporter CrcB n=1 Tax=Fontisphaera persica TaxID=2974023 RepID=UPI0024C08A59|nr:fluoride efflux transporter CrcB [Fontisphaera persica]WCJ58779.1 fluoride efflux transporter CrcB [Fontisphaera persica]